MSEQGAYERILGKLHEAALDDARWPGASALIDKACGARGNMLAFGDERAEGDINLFFWNLCYHGERRPDLERLYMDVYYPIDERLPRLRLLPDSQVRPVADLYTEEELKTSRTYNEGFGLGHFRKGLDVRLDGPNRYSRIVWSIADPVEADGWSSADVGMVEQLLPPIRQFVRVRQALVDARALGHSLAGLLDNARTGVIQLDRRGRIVAANDRGREILRKRDGLCDRDGTLQAESPDDQAALDKLLARALPRFGGQAESGSLVLRRGNALPRLVLHVTPVQDRDDARARRVAALVLAIDPMGHARIDPDVVRWAFGLSTTQSQLAVLLAEGKTVRDIAAESGRRESTVSWHMKQIFRKTGLSRQVEVVQLVRSLAGLPANRRTRNR